MNLWAKIIKYPITTLPKPKIPSQNLGQPARKRIREHEGNTKFKKKTVRFSLHVAPVFAWETQRDDATTTLSRFYLSYLTSGLTSALQYILTLGTRTMIYYISTS